MGQLPDAGQQLPFEKANSSRRRILEIVTSEKSLRLRTNDFLRGRNVPMQSQW